MGAGPAQQSMKKSMIYGECEEGIRGQKVDFEEKK